MSRSSSGLQYQQHNADHSPPFSGTGEERKELHLPRAEIISSVYRKDNDWRVGVSNPGGARDFYVLQNVQTMGTEALFHE